MLSRDSFPLGALIGAIAPGIFLGILYLINLLIEKFIVHQLYIRLNSLVLVSITLDLIIMRYYFVKLKYDRTGRGILVVTFIYMMLFFILLAKR
ncbi:MAG TPA: hypothetical protein PK711_13760 [Bacteroidales bacterium]|nr:hypothetical protein [Bacteroidales bacterium]